MTEWERGAFGMDGERREGAKGTAHEGTHSGCVVWCHGGSKGVG